MADTDTATERTEAAEAGGRDVARWMAALKPRDAVEAMLAEQMAAVHDAGTRALKRAAECKDHPQIEALYLRQAARLMHLFVRQAETLERRRVAADERAKLEAREAYFKEKEEREAEELRRREEQRLKIFGIRPPRQRRRRAGANGKGDGAEGARIDLPDGLYIPDTLSG